MVSSLDLAISVTINKFREREGLKMDEVADLMGIGSAVFYNKYNPNNKDHEFKASELSKLSELTNDTTIAKVLANSAGLNADSPKNILSTLIDAGAKSGEVLKVVKDAIADGKVTYQEYKESLSTISEAIKQFEEIQAAIEAEFSK